MVSEHLRIEKKAQAGVPVPHNFFTCPVSSVILRYPRAVDLFRMVDDQYFNRFGLRRRL